MIDLQLGDPDPARRLRFPAQPSVVETERQERSGAGDGSGAELKRQRWP